MLGAAMTVPMILACGPVAGFLLGKYILVNQIGLPIYWIILSVMMGFAASGMQVYRIIKRMKDLTS